MLAKAMTVWILGLLTLVPYGIYYLLFEAAREQYALLIVGILFWIFGYWGLAGPLLTAIKVRAVFRAIEKVKSRDELIATFRSPDTRDAAIELIASENHIPRFVATRVYDYIANRLSKG